MGLEFHLANHAFRRTALTSEIGSLRVSGYSERVATVTAPLAVGFSLNDAEIDPDFTKANRGTVALAFKPGNHRRVAVKIVGGRGIESLKVVEVA